MNERGVSTWRDQRGLDPTQDFTAEIERAIEDANYVVTCITPDTKRSDSFVRREIQYALAVKKPVIVVRFADIVPPLPIVNHTYIDFFRDWDSAFEHVYQHVSHSTHHYIRPEIHPQLRDDPFRPYLEKLYAEIVRFLDSTVFSVLPGQHQGSLITLREQSVPSAVQPSDQMEAPELTLAFFSMAGLVTTEEPRAFDNFQEAFDKYKGRLLLLGNAGAGKTTTLFAFARDAVAKRLDDPAQPLPVLMSVATWDADRRTSITDWIAEKIPPLRNHIGNLIERGEVLLFLDGLDELGAARERQADDGDREIFYDPRALFMQYLPSNNQVIIACRVSDYEAIGHKAALNGAITLQPLSEIQIKEYLRDLPELWQILQDDDELRNMAQSPLLLSLFAFAFAGLVADAVKLRELDGSDLLDYIFAQYLRRRFSREQHRPYANLNFTLEQIYEILGQAILSSAQSGEINASYSLELFQQLLNAKAQDFIALITQLNIIVTTPDGHLHFVHLNMRDHIVLHPMKNTVQRDPASARNWVALGRAQRLLGHESESLHSHQRALENDPDFPPAWHEKGLTYYFLKHHAEAEASLARAVSLEPTNTEYCGWHGELLRILNRLKEAVEVLAKATRLEPDNAELWAKHGQMLRAAGHYNDAILSYECALKLAPNFAWAWNGKGLALRGLNRLEEALECYLEAAKAESETGWYSINAALVLSDRKDYTAALDIMEAASRSAKDNPVVWSQRGRILRRLKRFLEALTCYERSLILAPDYAWAWAGKGLSLVALQRHAEALTAFEQAVQLDQTNAGFRAHLGNALYHAGRTAEAQIALLGALNINAENHLAARRLRGIRKNLSYSQVTKGSYLNLIQDSQASGEEARSMFSDIAAVSREVARGVSASMILEIDEPVQQVDQAGKALSRSNFSSIVEFLSSVEAGGVENAKPSPSTYRSENADEFKIGDRIQDRYEVADVRFGGMGVVYMCYDHQNKEPVAIKTFQGRFLENERAVARFNQEATTWILLEKHRYIVQARRVETIQNRPHIILEHIVGPEGLGSDLRSWIDHNRLDLPQSIEFGLQIALGMQHASQKVEGLVHRDLKPGNILVTHEGVAKITDFGLVRSLEFSDAPLPENETSIRYDSYSDSNNRLTRIGAIVGTAPYMSPEQVESKDVDIRSDIYAFGCILYEMLTGRQVFQVKKFSAWKLAHLKEKPQFREPYSAQLPTQLQGLVLACLEKKPANRPASWGEVVDQLAVIYENVTGEKAALEIAGSTLEVRELIDKGYSLTELSRMDEALEAYNRALALQDDNALAWARKGRTLRLLNRYDEALQCYDRALEIFPRYTFAWRGKGLVLERLGRMEQALACYEMSAQISPNDVWNWYNQADVLQNQNRYDDAIPLLEKALEVDPSHPNSWAKLGQIYRLQRRLTEAISAYEKAIELDPTYAWAHNGRGLALKVVGQHEEAVTSFNRATQYQPDEVWHWYNLAEMLVELGQYDEALPPVLQATRTDPGHAFSWAKLGQILRYVNRNEEALDAYDKAIALQPDYGWAINGKGIVLEHIGRLEEALKYYSLAAENISDSYIWHCWYNQGNVLALLGRYKESLPLLEQVTKVMPQHAPCWARMGNVLRHLKNFDEALEAYHQATRLDPHYAWAWNEQGIMLETLGRVDEALTAYEHASEAAPKDAYYILQKAELLIQRGQYQQSLELLEQALKLETRNARTWAKHGQVLRRLNRLEEALASYTRAVEIDATYGWAWNGRGLTLSELGRHEEALVCFRQATELDEQDVWYWYNTGDELVALDQFEEALKVLDQAIKLDPQHPESWAKRGQALRRLGKNDEALTAYDESLKLNPRYAWAWNGRGLVLEALGRSEDALASYERSAGEDPNIVWYFVNQIDLLLSMQRKSEALVVADQVVTLMPNNSVAWARRGQVLRRLGNHESAIGSYQKALDLDKTYAWAWNGLGLAFASLNTWDEAISCYERAVDLNQNDLYYWTNYGDALMAVKDYAKTVEIYQRALALDPTHEATQQKLTQAQKLLHE